MGLMKVSKEENEWGGREVGTQEKEQRETDGGAGVGVGGGDAEGK